MGQGWRDPARQPGDALLHPPRRDPFHGMGGADRAGRDPGVPPPALGGPATKTTTPTENPGRRAAPHWATRAAGNTTTGSCSTSWEAEHSCPHTLNSTWSPT